MPSFTYDALRINEELNQFHWTARKFHSNRTRFHFAVVAVENTEQRFTNMSRATEKEAAVSSMQPSWWSRRES